MIKFQGSWWKQEDKTAFTPKNVVSLFIVYELDTWSLELDTDITLFYVIICLFGSVKLTEDADPDKYKYSGYNIGFDSCSTFLLPNGSMTLFLELIWAHLCWLVLK